MKKLGLLLASASVLMGGTAAAQVNLTAETAAPTGVPGNAILAHADVAQSEGVANIQVKAGQTLTNVVQSVAEGSVDMGAAPSLLPFLMSRGAGPYAALGEERGAELADSLAMLVTYRFAVYGLSSYSANDFDGYGSVEGSTIFNGPPRGAALTKARGILTLATGLSEGEGYTGVQVNWGQAVSTMTDGSADAQILPMSFPDVRVSQAAASGDVEVFSFPKETFESEAGVRYGKAPGVVAVKVEITPEMFGPNTTVVSEDDMFRAYGDVGGTVVNVNMGEELAYQLTKAFLDNLATVEGRAPMMGTAWIGETDPARTGMCGPNPVKYHPGAVRAWEEAGYTIPECAQ